MTKEQIFTSLDTMLENPKAKTFLNHLVRSYMPSTNVTRVATTPKGDFKCVLTRVSLLSDEDVTKASKSEDFQVSVKNSMAKTLEGKNAEATKAVLGNKEIGVTGKDTTTFMSFDANQIFMAWIAEKALQGDKHINWLLGSIKHFTLIDKAESSADPAVQKKVANYRKQEFQSSTFNLENFDVLKGLKSKLEAEGK